MLAMVAVVIAARLVADRVNVPYTIVVTICGLIYAVLPGPNLKLEPQIVLVLIIPPLLYSAARRSSLLAIRANWRPIASLSVVLVLITTFAVAASSRRSRRRSRSSRPPCSARPSPRPIRSRRCRSAAGPACRRG